MAQKKKRLITRLFMSHLLLTILTVVMISWLAMNFLKNQHFDQTRDTLLKNARLFTMTLPATVDRAAAPAVNRLCGKAGAAIGTRITVILPDGRVVGDSEHDYTVMDNHGDRPEIREALAGGTGMATRYSSTLQMRFMYVAVAVERGGATAAVVRTSMPVRSVASAWKGLFIEFLVIVAVIAVVVAVVSYAASRRLSRPISQMIYGAARFADGNLNHTIVVNETREHSALAEAMNTMAGQLDERIHRETERRRQLEAVLSGMVEAVFAVDNDRKIIEYNRAALQLFSIRNTSVKGRYIGDVVRNKKFMQFVDRALSSEEVIEEEIVLFGTEERILQAHGGRIGGGNGQAPDAVLVLNDITRIKRLEKVRRDFVANVSHELKTPITSILGFVETLRDGAVEDRETSERFLKIVQDHTERLNGIIDDLLSLSRIEQESETDSFFLERIDLRGVVEKSVDACAVKAADRDITITLSCGDLTIRGNPTLLEQAFVNLIDNAVKYSDAGKQVSVTGRETADEVIVDVADSGCGIPLEHFPRIFERFYRVDKGRSRALGGTGLGLSIVKHIVRVHRGRVTLDSEVGKGSTFSVHLPRIHAGSPADDAT